MKQTRDWLATVSNRRLPGPVETERLYDEFRRELPDILVKLALRPEECSSSNM
jgi:hypothetical protein